METFQNAPEAVPFHPENTNVHITDKTEDTNAADDEHWKKWEDNQWESKEKNNKKREDDHGKSQSL